MGFQLHLLFAGSIKDLLVIILGVTCFHWLTFLLFLLSLSFAHNLMAACKLGDQILCL